VSGGQETGGVDMMLYAVAEYQHCDAPNAAIPDNSPSGLTKTLTFPESLVMSDVEVYVRVKHTFIGDLVVEVRSPEGTTVRLHNRTGGGADSLVGWYDTALTPSGPGVLADFIGEQASGEWQLLVVDAAAYDVGTLKSWCVYAKGGSPTGVDDGGEVESTPLSYELVGARPNPFNPVTSVVYGAPTSGAVRVAVYSVAGREVKVLVDGEVGPGYHEVVWDGRDGSGVPMASGVYFVRMDALGYRGSVKAVLLK
jgi:subtilisin-like proprotein convertase family protein